MLFVTVISTACDDYSVEKTDKLDGIEWGNINAANIYFGHQSVGLNLLDGLGLVKEKYPQLSLAIHPVDLANTCAAGIYQKQIGKNSPLKAN